MLASCLRCMRGFLDFGTLFGFSFFRENSFPSSTLFGLISEAPSDLHLQKFPSKVSSLYTFMVGFDFLSQECLSISFFFAQLGVFLKYSSGRRPQVGLFVSHCLALRPVLLTLYPLIQQSLVRYHFEMDPI